ncbi:sensor histidine kinase [Streptomyces violascens]|uniref:sensor histidine kinase n=1 Tax=Streptomyces violascens TaxID=67381 RepID=UPI00365712BD
MHLRPAARAALAWSGAIGYPFALFAAAPLQPAPGLADLDRLAAPTRDAGVHAEVRWLGQRRSLPPDIDLAAFRIVPEALTNVVRHADTPACCVTIGCQDGELAIEVADDGRGGLTSVNIKYLGGRSSPARGSFGRAGPITPPTPEYPPADYR